MEEEAAEEELEEWAASSREEDAEEEEEMVRDMVLVFFCTLWTLHSHKAAHVILKLITKGYGGLVITYVLCVWAGAGLTYCAMFQAFQEAVTEVILFSTKYKDRSRVSDMLGSSLPRLLPQCCRNCVLNNKQGFESTCGQQKTLFRH